MFRGRTTGNKFLDGRSKKRNLPSSIFGGHLFPAMNNHVLKLGHPSIILRQAYLALLLIRFNAWPRGVEAFDTDSST